MYPLALEMEKKDGELSVTGSKFSHPSNEFFFFSFITVETSVRYLMRFYFLYRVGQLYTRRSCDM
jgi:hypothetical protein